VIPQTAGCITILTIIKSGDIKEEEEEEEEKVVKDRE